MTTSSLAAKEARDLIREKILSETIKHPISNTELRVATFRADLYSQLAIEAITESPDIHLLHHKSKKP